MKKIITLIALFNLAIMLLTPAFAATTQQNTKEEKAVWSYSGKGDDVVTGFKSDGYYYVLKVYHNNKGHFAIKGYYGEKSYDYDLLINTTDPYIDGKTLLKPNREYTFEVTAKGDWKMDIYSLELSDTDSITAKGDYVQQKPIK